MMSNTVHTTHPPSSSQRTFAKDNLYANFTATKQHTASTFTQSILCVILYLSRLQTSDFTHTQVKIQQNMSIFTFSSLFTPAKFNCASSLLMLCIWPKRVYIQTSFGKVHTLSVSTQYRLNQLDKCNINSILRGPCQQIAVYAGTQQHGSAEIRTENLPGPYFWMKRSSRSYSSVWLIHGFNTNHPKHVYELQLRPLIEK